MSNDNWSEAETALAIELYRQGMSASKIAKAIGERLGIARTKNAMIGKIHRMKWHETEKPASRRSAARPPKKKVQPRSVVGFAPSGPLEVMPPLPMSEEPWVPIPYSRPVPIERHTKGCRWPVKDGRHFCNGKTEEKSSYCPEHKRRAYQKAA